MAAPNPTDSPARNTRQQARIEQRKQQLRAKYPYQNADLSNYLVDCTKEEAQHCLAEDEKLYETALHAAAANQTTWLLMELARASIRNHAGDFKQYLRRHYLPHLHCDLVPCTDCAHPDPMERMCYGECGECDEPHEEKFDSESVWEQRWKDGEWCQHEFFQR